MSTLILPEGLELVEDPSDREMVDHVQPAFVWRVTRAGWRGLRSATEWAFGLASLAVGLALLASVPILQFASLGYFLESSARVARSGRWRDGLIGVRKAARIGGLVMGIVLAQVPLGLVASFATSAGVIDPGGRGEQIGRFVLIGIGLLTIAHVLIAGLRGGRLRHFLWPVGSLLWLIGIGRVPRAYPIARDGCWDFLTGLRLPFYFRLGLVGFLGTFFWLAPPAILISQGGRWPLVGGIGTIWLALVVPFLPFLQVRYAVEDHWRALFQVKAVRVEFARAPWAFAFALLVLLAASIPLYLVKIEPVPQGAAWLPGLLFVAFLAPARILAGWAFARAQRRSRPRHWLFRLLGRLAIVPAAVLYVVVVLIAQYTTWGGSATLYQQHAFLLPASAFQP